MKTLLLLLFKQHHRRALDPFLNGTKTVTNKALCKGDSKYCVFQKPLRDDRCDEILKHLFGLPLSDLDRTISQNVIKCAAALLNKMPEGNFKKKI